jgi:hypothetical protein
VPVTQVQWDAEILLPQQWPTGKGQIINLICDFAISRAPDGETVYLARNAEHPL